MPKTKTRDPMTPRGLIIPNRFGLTRRNGVTPQWLSPLQRSNSTGQNRFGLARPNFGQPEPFWIDETQRVINPNRFGLMRPNGSTQIVVLEWRPIFIGFGNEPTHFSMNSEAQATTTFKLVVISATTSFNLATIPIQRVHRDHWIDRQQHDIPSKAAGCSDQYISLKR